MRNHRENRRQKGSSCDESARRKSGPRKVSFFSFFFLFFSGWRKRDAAGARCRERRVLLLRQGGAARGKRGKRKKLWRWPAREGQQGGEAQSRRPHFPKNKMAHIFGKGTLFLRPQRLRPARFRAGDVWLLALGAFWDTVVLSPKKKKRLGSQQPRPPLLVT